MNTTTVITGAWLHSSVETAGECAVVCRQGNDGRPALVGIRDAAGKIQPSRLVTDRTGRAPPYLSTPLGLFTPAAGELARVGL
ncbi:hypothetical protein ACRC7T_13795 [Segnochrobactraceae bacterium EtOH-i3]